MKRDAMAAGVTLRRRPSFIRNLRKHWLLFLMLVPAVLYVLIFSYTPMTGIVLAFKKYQHAGGIYNSPWNGLKNFRFLMVAGKLGMATRNTILYNLAFIVLGVIFDRDAMGMTMLDRRVLSTPLNTKGLYRNLHVHCKQRVVFDNTEKIAVLLLD